jgi:hypothetical protein
MIRKLLNINNLMYAAILVVASIYLIIKEGWDAYLNYASILLALFTPAFIVIYIYKLVKQTILKEDIDKNDIYILTILIAVALVAFFAGLENAQRVLLGLIDSVFCLFILLIMLYLTFRQKKS